MTYNPLPVDILMNASQETVHIESDKRKIVKAIKLHDCFSCGHYGIIGCDFNMPKCEGHKYWIGREYIEMRDAIGCLTPRSKIERFQWFIFGKMLHGYASRILCRMHEANTIGNDDLHYWNNFSARSLNRPGHKNGIR